MCTSQYDQTDKSKVLLLASFLTLEETFNCASSVIFDARRNILLLSVRLILSQTPKL